MKPIFTRALAAGDRFAALQQALLHNRLDRRSFIKMALATGASFTAVSALAQTLGDAAVTQLYNRQNLKKGYDYIVVGSGSGGAVVAGRLAAETGASVLVLEAGSTDQVDSVLNPTIWPTNIMTDLDWKYVAEPEKEVNGRALIMPMGRVVGGGSSINATVWAQGHRNDYAYWAEEAGDDGWSHEKVLAIYRRIEDWQGPAAPGRRGTGGRLYVTTPVDPLPIAPAMMEACESLGLPRATDMNDEIITGGAGGCGYLDLRIKDGMRRNVPMDYLYGVLAQPNITLLTGAEVLSLTMEGTTVTGLRFVKDGRTHEVSAGERVILSAGAINTPKILMLSGIGRSQDLTPLGIEMRHDLQGVGQNFQDHILTAGCVWEYPEGAAMAPRNNASEAGAFWKSDASLDTPDLQPTQIEIPFVSEVTGKQYDVPAQAWSISPGLVKPKSRGSVSLISADPRDGMRIDAAFLREEADRVALLRAVELCREIGNAEAFKPFVKREVMPGPLNKAEMMDFARNAAGTFFHESCTCKMGRDEMAVVDGKLSVHGLEGLSIADASVMPRITTGNTMAPTVIIGERMADILIGA